MSVYCTWHIEKSTSKIIDLDILTHSLCCVMNFMLSACRPNIAEVAHNIKKLSRSDLWNNLCNDEGLWRAGLDSRPMYVTFWSTEWHRYRFSCWMLLFSTVSFMPPLLHTFIHLHTTIIRQVSRQSLRPETKQCSFGYQGSLKEKCFHIKSPKVAHCYDQWKMLWLGN